MFYRTDNAAATPNGSKMVFSHGLTLASQETKIAMNSNMPFLHPDNVMFDYKGELLRKNIPISEIARLQKKTVMVTINVNCTNPRS